MRVARHELLGPPDRRQRIDQPLDDHGVQPADDRPPARVGCARLADQRGQHAATGREIIGQLGDGAQVRDRGAVARLLGGIGQLGHVDRQRGHRPGPQHRLAARGAPAAGAHQLGRGERPAGTARGAAA